jgi:hypothetical protein
MVANYFGKAAVILGGTIPPRIDALLSPDIAKLTTISQLRYALILGWLKFDDT